MLREGDLVLTEDGYYGIITGRDTVFLANGLEVVMTEREMKSLRRLPLNINAPDGSSASFREILNGVALAK